MMWNAKSHVLEKILASTLALTNATNAKSNLYLALQWYKRIWVLVGMSLILSAPSSKQQFVAHMNAKRNWFVVTNAKSNATKIVDNSDVKWMSRNNWKAVNTLWIWIAAQAWMSSNKKMDATRTVRRYLFVVIHAPTSADNAQSLEIMLNAHKNAIRFWYVATNAKNRALSTVLHAKKNV